MTVELYWIPGCTSCLRMKEFVESSGVPFESINWDEDPDGAKRLVELGGSPPAAVIGERWVDGGDLKEVAKLLGITYDVKDPLSTIELHARYETFMTILCGLLQEASPEAMKVSPSNWEWTLCDIAHHAASVMRVFLITYDPESYTGGWYEMDYATNSAPEGVDTAGQVIEHAIDTLIHFNKWWGLDGFDDPLDRVVETYWGHQSLHAALEREVWHTAQHVRQVEFLLRESGIEPTSPLMAHDLDGLPMPARVFT